MKFETVVQTISSENRNSFDNMVKAFYDTYSNVEVIGYAVNMLPSGKITISTTTLMGMKPV